MRHKIILFSGRRNKAQARRPVFILLAIFFLTPLITSGFAQSHNFAGRASGEKLHCGYDPHGALDEWYNHKLNLLRFNGGQSLPADLITKSLSAATVEDRNDIAVIEDNGSIVIPPNKFDLAINRCCSRPKATAFASHAITSHSQTISGRG